MYKIKFSSVTHALKAKEIIEKMGYRVKINKNSNPSKNEGCGYSVNFLGDINRVTIQLDIHKIKYLGYELV